MELYKRIKEQRELKQISQRTLASAIGYSQTVIGSWERGEKMPSSDALRKLAIFFDVSSDYLLGLEDELGNKINILP